MGGGFWGGWGGGGFLLGGGVGGGFVGGVFSQPEYKRGFMSEGEGSTVNKKQCSQAL